MVILYIEETVVPTSIAVVCAARTRFEYAALLAQRPKKMSSQTQSIDEVDSLTEAKKMVQDLRDKISSQARQLLAWRRAYKMQEVFISRLHHQKEDQLKYLSSKLLLFESRLLRKQMDISAMLSHREKIIHRQQRLIEILTNRLIDNGLDPPISDLTELDNNLLDLESLNDSDSAVVMEDIDSETFAHISKYKSNSSDNVTIVRSISDAIDPNLKYTVRRSNCYLRRPEILETVYSVEEDGDNESTSTTNPNSSSNDASSSQRTNVFTPTTEAANRRRDAFATGSEKAICAQEPQVIIPTMQSTVGSRKGSCSSSNGTSTSSNCSISSNSMSSIRDGREREKVQSTTQVTTYNRVMSNHRNVTKPKDVKYKRINKAKSKSLEELRGRLKNWVEQGTKFAGLSLEHSHSYA